MATASRVDTRIDSRIASRAGAGSNAHARSDARGGARVLRQHASAAIAPAATDDALPTDERMPVVSPLELREYLSAGVPIASTPVPHYRGQCHIATARDELVAAIAMKTEAWSVRVADVIGIVDEISRAERKNGR